MNDYAKLPRRRYSNQEKLSIVKAALSGERSRAAVARAHDINANQLSRWIKEYHQGAAWACGETRLLPVTVATSSARDDVQLPPAAAPARCDVEVVLNSGHTLRLNNPTETLLSHLLQVLT
ncbi:transposase [Methylophaga sp.]|uniref:IS66-like element accessory protein TnpA n=1 Tax=Methylophaga sp. TaxID=2024840 RepID=UPI001400B1E4|nr:transposase [Methylophaga sp.]MTI64712.1 transposase [Methylophaga sp.]